MINKDICMDIYNGIWENFRKQLYYDCINGVIGSQSIKKQFTAVDIAFRTINIEAYMPKEEKI